MRGMNAQRGEPPLTVPQPTYFTVRVPFAPEDLRAVERSMGCHRSQFTLEVVQRVLPAARVWNGAIPLIPAFATSRGTDLFQ
jgi:hypothetical protein